MSLLPPVKINRFSESPPVFEQKRTKIQLSLLIYVSQESIQEGCSTVNTLYKSQNLL